MEDMNAAMDQVKATIKEQMNKVWREGYSTGAVTTCAILYRTFANAGLEKTNIIYTILKDMAASEGCQDLEEYTNNMSKH